MAPCTIKWCGKKSQTSNFKADGITFHRYPKDIKLKEQWIKATRREDWVPSAYSVICSRHFTEDCFLTMKNRRRLLSSAVPSLLLPLLADSPNTECTLISTPDLKGAISDTSLLVNTHLRTPEHIKRKRLADLSSTSSTAYSISETPQKNKTKLISPSNYIIPFKKRLSRRIIELSDKIVHKNKQIKNLKQKTGYLKKKIASLKSIIKDLENKRLASAENADILSNICVINKELVQRQLVKSNKKGSVVRKK